MKKLYVTLGNPRALSWPLLLVSFIAGYSLATLIFYFFGSTIHQYLSSF